MAARQAIIVTVTVCLMLLTAIIPVARPASGEPLPTPAALYFPTTGQTVRGAFLDFWLESGESRLFGFPITAELNENGRLVQYFERARFEVARESAEATIEVHLGLVGREVASERMMAAFLPSDAGQEGSERRFFAATKHSLAFAFKRFWEENGGLAIFGLPLSEEFEEGGRTVQYFERARFEYQPVYANTPDEVQLGHVGREAALSRHISLISTLQPTDAVEWTPTLSQSLAERHLVARQQAALAAIATPVPTFQVVVTAPSVSLRHAPTSIGTELGVVYARHLLQVTGMARGELMSGDTLWYQVALEGAFVPATAVEAFTPPAPPRTWDGRWIDVNLTTFTLTVYEGQQPLRSALIIAGRKGRTPTGVFAIQRRVRSETMDSTTVGFPKGHPEYYYLKNVEFTQYFTGAGHAIHGNYWVHPSRFGQFLSNGCVGVRNSDGAWIWSLTTVGTPIHIHY